MYNILYITPKKYSTSRRAGGMGTKTKAIIEAWGLVHDIEVASDIDPEYADLYDFIIIELLGFRSDGKLSERCAALKKCAAPKLIYGSDSELLRWKGSELAELKSVATAWITNCEWQARYWQDFNIPVVGVVREPINCDLFKPSSKRELTIVAGGQISYQKQSDFFVDLFSEIRKRDTAYETVYIGGADLWDSYNAKDFELEHELKAVTDNFTGTISQAKVATELGKAGIGIVNSHYETCNRFGMELHAAGVPVVGGSHLCFDEWPHSERFTTLDDCLSLLDEMTDGFTSLPNIERDEIRDWAVDEFSYEASLEQLDTILRRMR